MGNTINLGTVIDLVKAAGFPAYVEYTGGGVATVYASVETDEAAPGGVKRHLAGPYNDEVVDVVAGPGFFVEQRRDPEEDALAPGAYGYLSEFCVGQDGDPTPGDYTATQDDDEASIAQQIIRRLEALR